STLRVPLGPLTSMAWPLMVVSTPFAKAMGALPIRDIVHTSLLPDVGWMFSAYALLGRLTVGQQAVGRGDDSHAEAAENLWQVSGLCVHTQTWLRHAAKARQGALTVVVLKLQGQVVPFDGVVSDVAFLLQDLSNVCLNLGGRHGHGVVLRMVAVPPPGRMSADGSVIGLGWLPVA